MLGFEQLVEERIRSAMSRGEFDGLPGAGRPLPLDDDALIPEELRMAVRVLKNSGHIPPEVEALRELRQLEAFIAKPGDEAERSRAWSRLQIVLERLERAGLEQTCRAVLAGYEDRLLERLSRPTPARGRSRVEKHG